MPSSFPPHQPQASAPALYQAMVLCAGRGERMRPLSDQHPKPLLEVQGKPLLQWHLERLAVAGLTHVLINTAWLGAQFPDYFEAHPPPHGLQLGYSREDLDFGAALETAGGVVRALPQLANPFWVMAGDVYMPDFVASSKTLEAFEESPQLAHLWLVPNPSHHPSGDFRLSPEGLVQNVEARGSTLHDPAPGKAQTYTFSTVALYKKAFFSGPWCTLPSGNPAGTRAPLAPMLKAAMALGLVGGSLFEGLWCDVGTPERLAGLQSPAPISPLAS